MKRYAYILAGLAVLNLGGFLWLSLLPSGMDSVMLAAASSDDFSGMSTQQKLGALELRWEINRAALVRHQKQQVAVKAVKGLLFLDAIVLVYIVAALSIFLQKNPAAQAKDKAVDAGRCGH